MILKMYTDVVVSELKSNINTNMKLYEDNYIFVKNIIKNYDDKIYDLTIDVKYPILDKSISTSSDKLQWEIDCNNSIILHKEFIKKYNIPMKYLSDERFIVYLTHDVYYDYMLARWPAKGKISRVKQKYFLPTGGQAFTRNMFLRMFWYSYITYDERFEDPYELTKIAFEYADPVNQIFERKYGRNEKIVKCALRAIKNTENSKVLNQKRTIFGKTINNILGIYSLDMFTENELINLFETEIRKICQSDIVDDEIIEEE